MKRRKAALSLLTLTMSSPFYTTDAQASEIDVASRNSTANVEATKSSDEIKGEVICNLNLRKSPEKQDGNIILTMEKGSMVEIISKSNGWAKVRYENKEGYAFLEYIDEVAIESNVSKTKKFTVNKALLNVRAGASTKYKMIGVLKKGEYIEGYQFNSSWIRVNYNGKEGYVSSKYLDEVKEETNILNKEMEVIGSSSVSVRAGAGKNYAIRGKISLGEKINVLSMEDGWARFSYKNADAYIEVKYLKEIVNDDNNHNDEYTYEKVEKTMYIGTSNGILRGAPSTDSSIMVILKKGDMVMVNSHISNGWSEINYNGTTLYILTHNLTDISPDTDDSVDNGNNGTDNSDNTNGTDSSNENTDDSNVDDNDTSNDDVNNSNNNTEVNDANNSNNNSDVDNNNNNTSNEDSNVIIENYKKEVLRLVNIERAKEGLCELTIDTSLSQIAQMKSQDMIDNNYFSHTSPIYGSAFDMMRAHGISYRVAGENIAKGHSTPQEVVAAWMNSPGHRKNIMNGRFSNLGMGVVRSQNGTIYWTQMFLGYN